MKMAGQGPAAEAALARSQFFFIGQVFMPSSE